MRYAIALLCLSGAVLLVAREWRCELGFHKYRFTGKNGPNEWNYKCFRCHREFVEDTDDSLRMRPKCED